MTVIALDGLSKWLGTTLAVADATLRVEDGELFFLLGPSGSGKSTLLGLIAGLEPPSAGSIRFDDRDVTALPTERRNAVLCFQSYALWPHKSVRENVGFGPKIAGLARDAIDRRVNEMLALVRMSEYAERKPAQLSGGQQQRVALARALAANPACLLLDEPLSNLDAKLRHEMRAEIRRICKSTGVTTVYVTHDQKEALATADRIAVMNQGRVIQLGTPRELYDRPKSAFIAEFIGHTNLMSARVLSRNSETVRLRTPLGELDAIATELPATLPEEVAVSIRPDRLRIARGEGGGANRFTAEALDSSFLGESSEHSLRASGHGFRLVASPALDALPRDVVVEVAPRDVVVLEEA
jgi:iron(III) transport system ATP-binding protein